MGRWLRTLGLATALAVATACSANVNHQPTQLSDMNTLTLAERQQDFDFVTGMIEEYYAPLAFKQQRFGFSWDELKRDYTQQMNAPELTRDGFVALMQQLVAQLRDGHTAALASHDVILEADQVATLGFATARKRTAHGSQAAVAQVFTQVLGEAPPIQVGDVLLSIDGRTAEQIIRDDITRYRNVGQDESNLTIGYAQLTMRANQAFAVLPTGPATVRIRRGAGELDVPLAWVKVTPDQLVDPSAMAGVAHQSAVQILDVAADGSLLVARLNHALPGVTQVADSAPPRTMHRFFQPEAAFARFAAAWAPADVVGLPAGAQAVTIGGMDFQLVNSASGKLAVYRVPDFDDSRTQCHPLSSTDAVSISVCNVITGEAYAAAFAQLAAMGVRALVIDVRGNPGGQLEFGYELVRAFSTNIVPANLATVRITDEWIGEFEQIAASTLVDPSVRAMYQAVYNTLTSDQARGQALSTPIPILGNPTLTAVPGAWTGPTYVLTDELCASMCDIFATLMQDLKRARTIGAATMGAGGNIQQIGAVSPHAKIGLTQTLSMIERLDGSFIENRGAAPDIRVDDTTSPEFFQAVLHAIDSELP
jgi:C-terminal processing protease CtpA/Prc